MNAMILFSIKLKIGLGENYRGEIKRSLDLMGCPRHIETFNGKTKKLMTIRQRIPHMYSVDT